MNYNCFSTTLKDSMKTLTLRLTDGEHTLLHSLALSRRTSMASVVMCQLDPLIKPEVLPAKPPKPLGKREQAFLEYKALIDGIPRDKSAWTVAWADRFIQSVGTQRVAAGNLSMAEMPLPPEIVAWKNAKTLQATGVEHDDPLADLAAIDWDSE